MLSTTKYCCSRLRTTHKNHAIMTYFSGSVLGFLFSNVFIFGGLLAEMNLIHIVPAIFISFVFGYGLIFGFREIKKNVTNKIRKFYNNLFIKELKNDINIFIELEETQLIAISKMILNHCDFDNIFIKPKATNQLSNCSYNLAKICLSYPSNKKLEEYINQILNILNAINNENMIMWIARAKSYKSIVECRKLMKCTVEDMNTAAGIGCRSNVTIGEHAMAVSNLTEVVTPIKNIFVRYYGNRLIKTLKDTHDVAITFGCIGIIKAYLDLERSLSVYIPNGTESSLLWESMVFTIRLLSIMNKQVKKKAEKKARVVHCNKIIYE